MKSMQHISDVHILIEFAFSLDDGPAECVEHKDGYAIPITPEPRKNLFTANTQIQAWLAELKTWSNQTYLYKLTFAEECPAFKNMLMMLADDHHRDDEGYTAILRAADQGSNEFLLTIKAGEERANGLRLCELLLGAGANINSRLKMTRKSRTDTQLHYFHKESGDTPLIIAVRHNSVAAVDFFVKRSAGVTLNNDNGVSALALAQKKPKILALLQPTVTALTLFSEEGQNSANNSPMNSTHAGPTNEVSSFLLNSAPTTPKK